jgi:hypothetical protein
MPSTLLPATLPDDALLREAARLVRVDREATAALVRVLIEVDARRLYFREGCSSLFVWCVQVLRLEEGAAYNRIEVARVARRLPAVLEALERGFVSLTAVRLLAPHLTAANHHDVLTRAGGLSKRDVQRLVVELAPQPAVPSTIHRVSYVTAGPGAPGGAAVSTADARDHDTRHAPSPSGPLMMPGTEHPVSSQAAASGLFEAARAVSDGPEAAALHSAACAAEVQPHAPGVADGVGFVSPSAGAVRDGAVRETDAPAQVATSVPAAARAKTSAVVPLSPTRYKLQVTIAEETHEKLRLAQALLRHTVPDGDLAEILDRALTVLVRQLERQRFAAAATPRPPRTPGAKSRYIPASVRRAVWQRDGGQCAFVGRQGRCRERAWLEFHHIMPYAAGGTGTVDNVSLRCRAHNAYEASLCVGADGIVGPNAGASVDYGASSGSSPPA